MSNIAANWKELSGECNWENMLDSPSADLRSYIIHYGERVQAIYDAFNGVQATKMYGFPRWPPEDLFYEVGLENGNPYKYTVTKYFYGLSEFDISGFQVAGQSAWSGYVAVATDEGKAALGRRDILISWRGTELTLEWIKDFEFWLTPASDVLGDHYVDGAEVHYGFNSIYTKSDSTSTYNTSSAREQVLKEVRTLVDKYKDEEISITVTGHSLGSSLGTLNAVDIVANGYNKPTGSDTACMVTAFVFASPHVGNSVFKTVVDGLSNLHILRVRNARDIVPSLPPIGYVDVGEEWEIDTTKSQFERTDITSVETLLSVWHNLENYLHGVAGYKGSDSFDTLVVPRSLSLVNKGLNILLKKYGIPPEWWVVKNKGMIQLKDGSWVMYEYEPDPPSN